MTSPQPRRLFVPVGVRRLLKPAVTRINRRLPSRRVEWGTLRRTAPFSDHFGYDRGRPISRLYIEGFLERASAAVRGQVLEVKDASYTRRFGGEQVDGSHVVDIDPGNRKATLVADLCAPGSLPQRAYDCVIFTQTLQYLPDEAAALENLWESLRPAGTLLVTVSCLQRIDPALPEADSWRHTPKGLERRLRQHCSGGAVTVEGHGNVLAAAAFLMGLAVEDLTEAELLVNDPFFPVIACGRVAKPAEN